MKNKFQSISWKIWYSMAGTIVVLLILALFANITILSKAKKEFIFEQLKESARAKRSSEQSFIIAGNEDPSLWVAHFRIEKNENMYNIIVDQFTQSLYINDKKDSQIIERIVDNIVKENIIENKGIINDSNNSHYYYVDWDKNGTGAMVFLTSTDNKPPFSIEVIILVFVVLIISFFFSRIVARKIAKPIQELEVFAEEVSKRNWNAKVPKTDTDEILHLSNALARMRDSLRIAEERDRQFLQSTSHDLKTPTMIIKGYAQALIDGVGIDSKKSAAEIIKVESDRLERKITQLLRLNTLGHSLEYSENREIIRIDRLINSIVSKLSVVNPELNWNLNLKVLEIKGDSEAFLIAFENIIENGLRYAKNSISISMNIGDNPEVKISNDGPPFEVNNPMVLFDSYKKDKAGKFGLGLAIVKKVVEAHGGSILAYNTKTGVEFKITFSNKF